MTLPCVRSLTFTIPGTSGGLGTSVNVIERNGNLAFTVDVLNTSSLTGDLRGIFFHASESILPGLNIVDKDPVITQTKIGKNNILDLGNGANLNGAVKGGFDIGIEFGYEGIGQGKYDVNGPVSFTLDATQDLTLEAISNMLFGARLTSVGVPGGQRNRSSKDTFVTPYAPDAKDDAYNIFEDGAIGLTDPRTTPLAKQFLVLANDTDADGDLLSITDIGGVPSHGTVSIAADGKSIFYTPTKDYAGADSFIYCISDGRGGTDFATVNVTIAAVADIPNLNYTILPGDAVNKTVVRVTATQTDSDNSEFIDRIDLSGLPAGVTVNTNGINPSTQPNQITQDFVLTLPLNQDTSFNLSVIAVSKEMSNGDEQTNNASVPILFDFNANTYKPTFLATNQSIWDSGNQFTFTDDRFIGIDVPTTTGSGGSLIGYNYEVALKAGFQSTLTFKGGEINANLNYNLGIDTNYNKTTDQLLISSSQLVTGGDFTTQGPQGSYKLDFIFNYLFQAALTYDIAVYSGNIISVGPLSNNFTQNILNLNSNDLALTIPFPAPFGSLSATLAWPNVATDANPTPPPNGEFSSFGASNNFLQLNLDLDQALADIFLGGVNPFDIGFDIGIVFGNLEIADLDLFGGLNFLQSFVLQAQGFTGTLHFENGVNQAFTFGNDILLSNALLIDAGGDNDGKVEFTLSLDPLATLGNNTELGFNIGYSFDLMKISGGYKVLTVEDSFNIGPVFQDGGTLPIASVDIYDKTFALDFAAQNFALAA